MRFVNLLNDIARAEDLLTIWNHAVRGFTDLGFSRVSFGISGPLGHRPGNPIQRDAIALSTLPQHMKKGYFDTGLFSRSALFRWSGENLGYITWSWLDRNPLSEEEIAVREEMRCMGMVAGLTLSLPPAQTRKRAMLCLVADDGVSQVDVDRLVEKDAARIQALGHMFYLRTCTLPAPFPHRDLTPRQCEALECVASGSTMQDTADRMGISLPTVEKHLRLAREVLVVDSTTQAVAKAIALNLIFHRGRISL